MTTLAHRNNLAAWARATRDQLDLPFPIPSGRVGLVACCSRKLDHSAPARELYCSRLFKAAVAWLEASTRCDGWAILSAKHGLVQPNDLLEPYDLHLATLPSTERARWAARTHEQLVARYGTGTIFLVLAGWEYRRCLHGLLVEDPIHHWTQQRRDRGMTSRRAALGVGLIYKMLREGKAYP